MSKVWEFLKTYKGYVAAAGMLLVAGAQYLGGDVTGAGKTALQALAFAGFQHATDPTPDATKQA